MEFVKAGDSIGVTLSKCDKEEMETEIKIAAEKWPTTAVALCTGCGDGLGFVFWR